MDINGINQQQQREKILRSFATTYYRTVMSYKDNNRELTDYFNLSNSIGAVRDLLIDMHRNGGRLQMLETYCYFDSHGIRRLDLSRPDLEPVDPDIEEVILHHWNEYLATLGQCRRVHYQNETWIGDWVKANVSINSYYHIKSIAARIGAGLGSLGQPRYYLLIEGPTNSQSDDIMLDMKREPVPEWWNFVHLDVERANVHFSSEGQRICLGIHALTIYVDHDVGYLELNDGSYIIRGRSPWKGAVNIDALREPAEYQQFTDDLARITAINHCRADNDFSPIYIPYSFESALAEMIATEEDEEQFAEELIAYSQMNAQRIAKDFSCYIQSGMADDVQ